MNKIKDDLGSLLLAELLVQASSGDLSSNHKAPADTLRLAEELDTINTMVSAGELTEEQAVIHRQLRLNAFKMELLSSSYVNLAQRHQLGCFSPAQVEELWVSFDASFSAILKLELAKKYGR